jgi:hypothetical protein
MLSEPSGGKLGDLLEGARFFEQMRRTWNDLE